jgi:hypothetical protein
MEFGAITEVDALSDFVIDNGVLRMYTGSASDVVLPAEVTTIGNNAFSGNIIVTSVTIPASVTTVEYLAFTGCRNLTDIAVETGNVNYSSVNGVLFNSNQTTLFIYPQGKTWDYTIPNSVTKIARYAFYNSRRLTAITIPDNVTDIGNQTFFNCQSLTSVNIPEKVNRIGWLTFSGCSSLTTVNIPASVGYIGGYAFQGCALTDVTVGWATPLIFPSGYGVFDGVNLSRATLHVPTDTKELYKAAAVWKEFGTIVEYSPVGILPVDNALSVSAANGVLIINTPKAEKIYVYSVNGSLLFQAQKSAGEFYPISHLPKGVLFVRGDSGWVKKIVTR